MYLQRLKGIACLRVLLKKSVFTESKRLGHLGYRTWYTKGKEYAQFYGTDIVNVSDLTSSKQAIRNNIEDHNKTSWE